MIFNKTAKNLPFLLCLAIGALGFRAVSADDKAPNSILKESKAFQIGPQPLSSALLTLSQATKIRILFDANITRGIYSQGLSGHYSPEQALHKLLEKTGISYRLTSSGSIRLQAGDAETLLEPKSKLPLPARSLPNTQLAGAESPPPTLATMKVVSKFKYKPDDPYNPDYALPNATAGTKTDTPIMETPLNVQVVSKQVLKDQQVISLDQALKNVSGVTMLAHDNNFGINYLTPVIRGFASQTFFRNGFRLQAGSASRQFANVDSVEVLKGPAAVLYGQVEPGGMVNVVTKKPLATPYYALNQQFGSYDLYRTSVDATGPVNNDKSLLYRVNFSYQNSNSFRDFVYTDDVFVAPTIKWVISPKTWVSVEMEYDRNNNGYDAGFIPIYNGKILNKPFSYNWGELSPIKQETFFGNITSSHKFNDDWSIKHQLSINNAAGDGDLYFPYPSINQRTVRSTRLLYDNLNDTYSTNLDLTGHFGTFGIKHTLLLGGDYYRLDTYVKSGATAKYTPGVNYFNPVHHPFVPPQLKPYEVSINTQLTDQYGLYAQDQIKLPFNFHVMGGVRYQYLSQSSMTEDYLNNITPGIASSEDALTPRVGLLWQAQDWLSLYANYVESFGANSTGLIYMAPNQYKPIPGTGAKQYEIGAKTEFFEGRLRATLAYYDLTKTNIAVGEPPGTGHICPTPSSTCSLLIGETNSKGPELDIQGEFLPGWKIIATYANTNVVVTKGDPDGIYKPGEQLFGIPHNTATFWNTYNFQQTALKGFTVGAGINYQSEVLARKDSFDHAWVDTPFYVLGFKTVGLMSSYSQDVGDAKVTVQLNVDNLLDERYYTGLFYNQPYGLKGEGYGVYGTPRTFIGQISVQY